MVCPTLYLFPDAFLNVLHTRKHRFVGKPHVDGLWLLRLWMLASIRTVLLLFAAFDHSKIKQSRAIFVFASLPVGACYRLSSLSF